MAKLEELVTPTELLDAIRDGALKQELVKQYRTSDQELAKTLLPLYRRGKLTKEEFNDFFKGVPLRSQVAESEAASPEETDVPTSPDLPPSQILRALSEVVENPMLVPEEPAVVPPAPKEEPPTKEAPVAPTRPAQESTPEKKVVASKEAPASRPGLLLVSPRESSGEDASGVFPVDSAGMAGLLDMIFAKLSSIEDRLSRIEEKIASK
jgi:hypothetical protein